MNHDVMVTPTNGLQQSPHIRSIAFDIVVTLLTCGLFNIYVQFRQMQALNDMLKIRKYSFGLWLILTLVTCGIYHIYHEYRKSADLMVLLNSNDNTSTIVAVLMSLFGLSIVADAIQQSEINQYHGNSAL